MRISILGFIGRYPMAGVTAYFLQYALGLQNLGHDVFYIEDSGACPYDPVHDTISMDVSYSLAYVKRHLEPYGLAERWTYADYEGNYFGMNRARTIDVLRTSDLLVNVSAANILREEHLRVPKRILIDADPPYLQIDAAKGIGDTIEFLRQHTILFTFAENIGGPRWHIPPAGFEWQTTRQPVVLDLWHYTYKPDAQALTTIMNWKSYANTEYQGEVYGQKDLEFMRFAELPQHTTQVLDLGIGHPDAPREQLRALGWRLHDPYPPTRDLWAYQSYLADSRGEFTVAKNAYVRPWSGWFSERDTCYMATGKPVIAQDTGFSVWLPAGDGVFAFNTLEEARDAIERMNSDYEHHCKAARRLVEDYFNSDQVLRDLLHKAGCE
jgi:hypothetical protein